LGQLAAGKELVLSLLNCLGKNITEDGAKSPRKSSLGDILERVSLMPN